MVHSSKRKNKHRRNASESRISAGYKSLVYELSEDFEFKFSTPVLSTLRRRNWKRKISKYSFWEVIKCARRCVTKYCEQNLLPLNSDSRFPYYYVTSSELSPHPNLKKILC